MRRHSHNDLLLLSLALALLLLLAGCEVSAGHNIVSSGGNGSGGGTAGQLYISTQNSILHFNNAENANGNVAPIGAITGPNTLLSAPRHLFLDSANDRLYVANQGGASVLVFDNVSTLNGDVSPTRVISGNVTGLVAPLDVTLDSANNLLYVADGTSILVFAGASTITGNAPSVRNITMSTAIGSLFLDATRDKLYVSDPGNNAVDRLDGASLQNGAAIIGGSLTGPGTGLSQPQGLALDLQDRLIVSNSASPGTITLYPNAAIATGDAAPAADISGSNTLLQSPRQIAFNPAIANGELFVLDPLKAAVLVFTNMSAATGNVAPARTISGSQTGITANAVNGLAIDPLR